MRETKEVERAKCLFAAPCGITTGNEGSAYINAAKLDTGPRARSYPGGNYPRSSSNHFQSARSPFCSGRVLRSMLPISRPSFGMCECHDHNLAAVPVEDHRIWISFDGTTLAAGKCFRKSRRIRFDHFDRGVNLRCESDCSSSASLRVPIKCVVEFLPSRGIDLNVAGHV